MVLVACGDDEPASAPEPAAAPETTTAPETTSAPEPATDEAAPSEDPTSLRIAAIFLNTADDTWSTSLVGALERVAAERPRGLDITFEIFENIAYADGERVIRQTAETGNFDMIIAHSTYSDGIYAVRDDFPDILFSFTGSGNEGRGGNAYWLDVLPHEAAYLTGVAAGRLNETGVIGAVAAFPFPNVNGPVNAFFEGARSVNPDIETRVTYIESWFDPAAAQEAGTALIEEGAGQPLRGFHLRDFPSGSRGGPGVRDRRSRRPGGTGSRGRHHKRVDPLGSGVEGPGRRVVGARHRRGAI